MSEESLYALLSGAAVGAALKLLDYGLTRKGRIVEERKDLRAEVKDLWARTSELQDELDETRTELHETRNQNEEQSRQIADLTQKNTTQAKKIQIYEDYFIMLRKILEENGIPMPVMKRASDMEID